MLYTIVGILVIIFDQVVKLWVGKNINDFTPVKELIPGVVSLVRVQNDGAAFSFLAGGGARIWFILLTVIFTLLVIIALATNFISGKFGRWCMVLVTAGGLSNCLDRVLYGYVLDMFRVDLFNFAVFNVADIFISLGCIAFILYILFGGEKEPEPDADEYDEEDEEEEDRPVRQPLFRKRSSYQYDDYDEEEDDEDEEEEEMPRRGRKAERVSFLDKLKASRYEEDDEDEDDEDEEEEPVRRPVKKQKEAAYVQKSASPKTSKPAAKPAARTVPAEKPRRSAAEEDAEFEAFFARREADKKKAEAPRTAAPARKPAPVQKPAVDSSDPFAEWERAVAAETAKEVRQPQRPAPIAYEEYREPVSVPKPVKEAPAKEENPYDDFDLESILNEFK